MTPINNKPTDGEAYAGELTGDPAHIYEMMRAIGKPKDLLGNPISDERLNDAKTDYEKYGNNHSE